jgi:hypothetical protein
MPSEFLTTPDPEREALRTFFASHYHEIHRFAVACNMTIDRWPHNTDTWSLCFTPPQGGSAGITIRPLKGGTFKVHTGWCIDDYDAATRSIKHWESSICREGEVQLTELLRKALNDMLEWRKGDWSLVSKTPPGVQKFTREQWENMQVHWPKVRRPAEGG